MRRTTLQKLLTHDAAPESHDPHCPICMAEAAGPLTVEETLRFLPSAEGEPPPGIDLAFVVAEARAAFATMSSEPDAECELMAFATFAPNGKMARSSYTVDAAGVIHWVSHAGRRTVARLPIAIEAPASAALVSGATG